MDRTIAYRVLSQALEKHRNLGFSDLRSKIGKTISEDVIGPSQVLYTVDLTFSWSDATQRSLVVQGRIDDQNTFRFSPLEERISILNPDSKGG